MTPQRGCDPRVENCCSILIISPVMNSSIIAVGMSYDSNNERILKPILRDSGGFLRLGRK